MADEKEIIFNEREIAIISASVQRAYEPVRSVEDRVKQLNWFLGAIVVVFFVGFLTMVVGIGGIIWTAYQANTISYNEYRSTIQPLKDESQQKKEIDLKNNIGRIEQ